MSEMTREQLASGVAALARSMQDAPYVTPMLVKQHLGLDVTFAESDPHTFGAAGSLIDGPAYTVNSITMDGTPPRRFDITFRSTSERCEQPISFYFKSLVSAGFEPRWLSAPRLGSRARWRFEQGDVRVTAFVGEDAIEDAVGACVASIDISKNR